MLNKKKYDSVESLEILLGTLLGQLKEQRHAVGKGECALEKALQEGETGYREEAKLKSARILLQDMELTVGQVRVQLEQFQALESSPDEIARLRKIARDDAIRMRAALSEDDSDNWWRGDEPDVVNNRQWR